ncbi:KICSTOR complex protein kaptin [Ditylenchus destructor]|uniref:KICSTOR complex protein kaptin n=1 Tax=Ditylenchus destructor TaxID=166010 RepID=A0AAD4R3B6_9BILA|nr:KICSTOR complex protein kaptin [Ditylenchus destructor]
MIVDINGLVHWLEKQICIDLKEYLHEDETLEPFSLELVASDSSQFAHSSENLGCLATCWVVYDRLFAPERYFAAIFQFSQDLKVNMITKFAIDNAPTYTRLTTTSPLDTNQLYWLIFSYSRGVQAFSVNNQLNAVELVEHIGDIFPVLDIGDLPGSAVRSHCWIANGYRFSVVGHDTGYVIASCCSMQSGTIVDRKTIKFSGPISVLRLINENEEDLVTSVLVSSTLGPAVIWSLKLEDDILLWEMKTKLLESEISDAITCCAVNSKYIFIGTYGEQLLAYNLEQALTGSEVYSAFTLNVASPMLSVAYLEAHNSLLVLSTKGLHKFMTQNSPTNFSISSNPLIEDHLTLPV